MAACQSAECELLLIVILGGPGSGKTTLATCLGDAFPGLHVVSGGDLARLAVSDAAISRSPRLASLTQRLADRRHARQASLELNEVVTVATASGVRSCPGHGLIVDGFRPADLPRLEQALSSSVTCILWLQCSREVMINRLLSRAVRAEDKRLGSADSVVDSKGHMNAYKRRVNAYWTREMEDSKELNALHYVVHRIDGATDQSAVKQAATSAMWQAAAHAGCKCEWLLSEAQLAERRAAQINWLEVLISITLDSGMATAETARKAPTKPNTTLDIGLAQDKMLPPLTQTPVAAAEVSGEKHWVAMDTRTLLPGPCAEQWCQQYANASIGPGSHPVNAVSVGDWSSYAVPVGDWSSYGGNFHLPNMEAGCWATSGAQPPWWGGADVSWPQFATAAPQWYDGHVQEQLDGTAFSPGTRCSF